MVPRSGGDLILPPQSSDHRLDLFDELGLELHRADSIDFAVNIVIGSGIDPDVFHLGSDFQGGGGSFYLEVFGELHGVSALEFVSVSVPQDLGFRVGSGFFSRPFVPAIGAGKERAAFVGVFGLTLGAIWDFAHLKVI